MNAPSLPLPQDARTLIRWHLASFGVGLVVLGLAQILAPHRWDTGIYQATYYLIGRPVWAAAFIVVGAFKLAAAARYPRLALPALTAGTLIIAWWAVSFTIATLTDPRFPPTGAVAWLWLLGVHFGIAGLFNPRGDEDGIDR